MIGGKLHNRVHCHVCPLKDICEIGDDETSYRYHHYWDDHFAFLEEKSPSEKKQHNDDLQRMMQITINCPLKACMQCIMHDVEEKEREKVRI